MTLDKDAVTATDAEVRALLDAPPVVGAVREASAATDAELRAFERIPRRAPAAPLRLAPWIAGGVLVAAMAAFVLVSGRPDAIEGTVVALGAEALVLGDARLTGDGHVRIRSVEPLQIELVDGDVRVDAGEPIGVWDGDQLVRVEGGFLLDEDGVHPDTVSAVAPPERRLDAAPAPRPAESAPPPPAIRRDVPTDADAWNHILDRLDRKDPEAEIMSEIRTFRRKYPESAFSAEADATELELSARVVGDRRTLDRIDDWLATHERSPRRDALVAAAAEIAREELHDCPLALPYYEELARRRADGTVSAWYGLCLLDAGRTDEAREALETARQLGVAGPLGDRVRAALEGR